MFLQVYTCVCTGVYVCVCACLCTCVWLHECVHCVYPFGVCVCSLHGQRREFETLSPKNKQTECWPTRHPLLARPPLLSPGRASGPRA